jgi:hypothetical protein
MANPHQIHPVYARMDFPAYEFTEYPKMVYPGGMKSNGLGQTEPGVIVNDADEEAIAMAGHAVVREEDERARLLKVAEVKGVTVDKRWGVDRLTAAIKDAGFDAAMDPFS